MTDLPKSYIPSSLRLVKTKVCEPREQTVYVIRYAIKANEKRYQCNKGWLASLSIPKRERVNIKNIFDAVVGKGLWEDTSTMILGSTPNLLEMLEVVPSEEMMLAFIVRLNKDGTDETIYRWSCGCDVESPQWVLVPPKH